MPAGPYKSWKCYVILWKKPEKITLLIFNQTLGFINEEMQVQGIYAQSQNGAYSVQKKAFGKILAFTEKVSLAFLKCL